MYKSTVWLSVLLLLAGCGTAPVVPPEPEAPVAEPEEELPSRAERQAALIENWLDEADRALSQDRLLTPANNNAHDRYRAVLLLDPGNTRASSGLQAIVLRYLELARLAAGRGALSEAEAFLERAAFVDEDNPLVAEFAQTIVAERERQRTAAALEREGRRYQLNTQQLSARSEELVDELHELAREVRESEEFVLITARTDAEGRWIYQQMREAVPDYRLRGDIHLGSPPRIELEDP